MRTAGRISALWAIAAVLLVAGLGTSSGAMPRHHHRRHHHHQQGGGSSFTVAEADNGSVVRLPVGQTLAVELHSTGVYLFTAPESADTSILAELASSADPSTGDAHGQFVGARVGSTELSSAENPRCYPQCLIPSLLWRVTVVVVPSPVAGGH